ncbi:unnamed protein product [Adineta steineri]|uniref:Uncharacterized protein n=1 Tax=Adineta steineri TaxID=433720 RepID=A0A819UTV3_9BILA|nr:unnamed protein product [Adineta steineri]CAF4086156.1 unnamed protein product [Adineta steineri]
MPVTSRPEPNDLITEVTEIAGTILSNNFTDVKSTSTIKQEIGTSPVTVANSGLKPMAKIQAGDSNYQNKDDNTMNGSNSNNGSSGSSGSGSSGSAGEAEDEELIDDVAFL